MASRRLRHSNRVPAGPRRGPSDDTNERPSSSHRAPTRTRFGSCLQGTPPGCARPTPVKRPDTALQPPRQRDFLLSERGRPDAPPRRLRTHCGGRGQPKSALGEQPSDRRVPSGAPSAGCWSSRRTPESWRASPVARRGRGRVVVDHPGSQSAEKRADGGPARGLHDNPSGHSVRQKGRRGGWSCPGSASRFHRGGGDVSIDGPPVADSLPRGRAAGTARTGVEPRGSFPRPKRASRGTCLARHASNLWRVASGGRPVM
jgi:hypothetical protein